MHEYDDIINIKNVNLKHPRMSIYNRSAQFAPFSALVGFSDEISETGRITNSKIVLSEDKKQEINNILLKLKYNDSILITYFIKDNKKSGGKYLTKNVTIKKIDYLNKELILKDKNIIKINDILDIKTE